MSFQLNIYITVIIVLIHRFVFVILVYYPYANRFTTDELKVIHVISYIFHLQNFTTIKFTIWVFQRIKFFVKRIKFFLNYFIHNPSTYFSILLLLILFIHNPSTYFSILLLLIAYSLIIKEYIISMLSSYSFY